MGLEQIERRLAAILIADVAGYSRLIGIDDEGTLVQLNAHHVELIEPKIREYRGRVIRATGDGLLVLFVSAMDALRCAVEIQRAMTQRNARVPADKRVEFRMGVNVGDVVEGASIHGDGINVAARLEALADPGGICVSSRVQEDVRAGLGRLGIAFEDIGQHHLKNIQHSVHIYRVLLDTASTMAMPSLDLPSPLAAPSSVDVIANSRQRRLVAIVAVDIAGYSALMGSDEEGTVRDLKGHQAVVLPMIGAHGGRVIDTAGDGILVEFASVLNAVNCAVAVQKLMTERNSTADPLRRMQFRIGINQGDVISDGLRIYGDGVNIAARLEALARPGGICISGKVFDEIRGKLTFEYEDLGPQQLKNITVPVPAYRIGQQTLPEVQTSLPRSDPVLADRPTGVLPITNTLQLFGSVSLRLNGQNVPLRSLKARAILGYIALGESFGATRERLVGVLWSAVSSDRARAGMRQVARELQGRMEAARWFGLNLSSNEIVIDPNTLRVDVLEVLKAVEAGEVHPLLLERQRITEDLLTGLEEVDPAFRVWLIAKRNTLRDRLVLALQTAMAAEPAGSRPESKLAMALLNLDPTHEDACRRLMLSRASVGDVAGALRIYKGLKDILAENYSLEPSPSMKSLVAEIKAGSLPGAFTGIAGVS